MTIDIHGIVSVDTPNEVSPRRKDKDEEEEERWERKKENKKE